MVSGAARRGAPFLFALALLPLLLWRPVLYGSTIRNAGLFALFLAAYVYVPGWLAYRRFRSTGDDWLLELGMGWTLGHVMQTLAYLLLKTCGAAAAFGFYPLLIPLLLIRRRGGGPGAPQNEGMRPPGAAHLGLLAALVTVAVLRTRLASGWAPAPPNLPDMLFHAGNVAELALLLSATVSPALLALQACNAGRLFGGSWGAGLASSALLVLHVDLGEVLSLVQRPARPWALNSFLDHGIYGSPSTCLGLVLFATLAIVLRRWLTGHDGGVRQPFLAAALALVASGVKGSVMPTVLAGLAGWSAWTLLRRRRLEGRALAALGLLGLASAPMTLSLALGENSYAPAMFRPAFAAAMQDSPAYGSLAAALGLSAGSAPPWFRGAMLPLWLAGYLGLTGFGCFLLLARRRGHTGPAEGWLWMNALAGALPAILLVAPGYSQLFFLYGGQVGLAVLCGGPVAAALLPGKGTARGATLVVWASGGLMLAGTAFQMADPRWCPPPAAKRSARAEAYEQGLAWIRQQAPEDSVLVRRGEGMLLSVFAERRTLYETSSYVPATLQQSPARGWAGPAPGPALPDVAAERIALRDRFLAGPDRDSLAEVHALVGRDAPIYAVLDRVRRAVAGDRDTRPRAILGPIALQPSSWRLEFGNQAIQIYRFTGSVP